MEAAVVLRAGRLRLREPRGRERKPAGLAGGHGPGVPRPGNLRKPQGQAAPHQDAGSLYLWGQTKKEGQRIVILLYFQKLWTTFGQLSELPTLTISLSTLGGGAHRRTQMHNSNET